MLRVTIAKKVNDVINSYVRENGTDTIMSKKEIHSIIEEKYNELKKTGKNEKFLLTDYCYNNYNKGLSDKKMKKFVEKDRLLEKLEDNSKKNIRYRILGSNYPYTGEVYHTPKGEKITYIIGEWKNGKFYLYENEIIASNTVEKAKEIDEELDNFQLEGKTKEQMVKIRVNQTEFRQQLLERYHKCCLCCVSDPNLLVASHIKPWSVAEPTEKLDVNNGLLLCPNHDKLFDNGYITFDDNGKIIISERLQDNDKLYMNVEDNMKIDINDKNKAYMEYHRKNIFDKF